MKLDLTIKNKQLQDAKLFEVAKLQSVIAFCLYNKPIIGIKATSGLLSGFFIIFNFI